MCSTLSEGFDGHGPTGRLDDVLFLSVFGTRIAPEIAEVPRSEAYAGTLPLP